MISLESISDKVKNGQRITDGEALFLFESNDLLGIGELASLVE